jgi:hypothetical protein
MARYKKEFQEQVRRALEAAGDPRIAVSLDNQER